MGRRPHPGKTKWYKGHWLVSRGERAVDGPKWGEEEQEGQQGPGNGGGLWGLSCGHGGPKIWAYRGQLWPQHTPPSCMVLPLTAGLTALQTILCLLFAPLSLNPLGISLCSGLTFYQLTPGGAQKLSARVPPQPPTHRPAFIRMPSLPTVQT